MQRQMRWEDCHKEWSGNETDGATPATSSTALASSENWEKCVQLKLANNLAENQER